MKNRYEIRGEETIIFLEKKDGRIFETVIDTDDLSKVDEYKGIWNAVFERHTNTYYVNGTVRVGIKKRNKILLHRLIMNAKDGFIVDHINHDTLNNKKNNLRELTRGQNVQNRSKATVKSKTGIRGVLKEKNKYQAVIFVNGKHMRLGRYTDIKEAEKAVIEARAKYMPYSQEALAN